MPTESFDERFTGPTLNQDLWVDHYLPQWSEPARSRARYDFTTDGLRLRIDADQMPWRDADGSFRVSNLQTGTFSGAVGTTRGTHRHRLDGLLVETPQVTRRLWTPSSGELEVVVSASADPTCMLAIWLVGFEESGPEDSGELCVTELFGDRIGPLSSTVRVGIKAHHDPRLTDDVRDIELPIDATKPHAYGVRWSGDGVDFTVDGQVIMSSPQQLAYEQQLMIDLFEFPATEQREPRNYPKTAMVHSVAGTSAS
ncbi:family 16 glycosylhydrolase [Paenarthrobacter nitroguajacolicus]|uniref:Family 16 glycosylhydrolase n=1 Tax=Paenarthrobacter nitroguajacolicus TaxID=211146 RepID=A0A558H674_PAENT|nr:family 16 glycosylhydrolase [Paenarthrobacter nitroguajacolicus]TVU64622.1 family 16 glycosylhydrolase [Paenarthrobacter nitroguajacolicus]